MINGELDSLGSRSGTEVVHASLETLLPSIEVHRSELSSVRLSNENVERLRLVNEGTAEEKKGSDPGRVRKEGN